ncbi:MAG: ATP-dependent helicase [Clostridia bacterium]|nr:ATP-dependent helicase [Clostridia bacterium]
MSITILKSQKTWMPENIVLENAAMEVVKSDYNTLVIAGPGAGKTELLAQRACYLLQTNTCPYPKRILAVSFKKDSASNLGERVKQRCGQELSCRLDSYTFDKFCKEILDRFIMALPESFRPDKNYRIDTDNSLLRQAYQLAGFSLPKLNAQESKPKYPSKVIDVMTKGTVNFEPALNFNLISRFAIYILKNNEYILKSLQKTYSHVFLDEFQDTTSLQYEFVKTCFQNTSSVITAVGDQKQRIMLWAGAMPDVADRYIRDFDATSKTMVMNHRSAPKLLSLQKALYATLNEKEIDIIPGTKYEADEGIATIAVFDDDDREQEFIKNKIIDLLNSGTKPRDICILVKRSINEYLNGILDCEIQDGIKIRNEVIYQDLLKEDVVNMILAMLFCSVSIQNPDAYMYIQEIDLKVHGIDIDDIEKVNSRYLDLDAFLNGLNNTINKIKSSDEISELRNTVDSIFKYLGEKEYRDMYPQYENGEYFNRNIDQVCNLLWEEYVQYNDWIKALNSFEGETSIPAMTIHKSKGLEYEAVFVVGIEDEAFFASNRPISSEDASAFFVAVSRAKKNLYITTSKKRLKLKKGGVQSYGGVKPLYDAIHDYTKIEVYE